ncbi:hypothetical protein, partial [Acinetobacter baumannii]|uniref:hypothetical protein n=1 Tax=Acinetobacter baumannii TaxID=470 RepID=UPI001C0760A9
MFLFSMTREVSLAKYVGTQARGWGKKKATKDTKREKFAEKCTPQREASWVTKTIFCKIGRLAPAN